MTTVVAGFVAALGATALARRIALYLRVVAEPNARSSHAETTASAGGIGFVVPLIALMWFTELPPHVLVAISVGGAAMAVVGFVDDWVEVSRRIRLVVQAVVCSFCLWLFPAQLGVWIAVYCLGLVWFVNLYNFMDGIDGLAASQAVAFALGVLVVAPGNDLAILLWLIVATGAGFLAFNWAPARIFMGDVGSGFLGVTLGVIALHLHFSGALPLVSSLILLGVFWFDASYTLCVRIVTGQAFTAGHRTHLYQVVARRLGHGRTSTLFWVFWTIWLLPLAYFSLLYESYALVCLVLSCVPLMIGCIGMRAGLLESAGDR